MTSRMSREAFLSRARRDLEVQRDEARAASKKLASEQDSEYSGYRHERRTQWLRRAHHAKRS